MGEFLSQYSLSFPPWGAGFPPTGDKFPQPPAPPRGVRRVSPAAVGLWWWQETPLPPPARTTPGQRQRAEMLRLPVPVSPAQCHHTRVTSLCTRWTRTVLDRRGERGVRGARHPGRVQVPGLVSAGTPQIVWVRECPEMGGSQRGAVLEESRGVTVRAGGEEVSRDWSGIPLLRWTHFI